MEDGRPTRIAKIFALLQAVFGFSLGVVVLAALSFLLGNKVLSGPVVGNDSPLHLGYAVWLDQFFPWIPHWYPVQGGGESLLHGYPILPHLIVVLAHRATGLSIIQAFKLISFMGFPLTALGIYLLAWGALGRQSTGLIAGSLYLLAPLSWTWLYDWGFFPQHVALVFLPLSLLAFDKSMKYQLDRRKSGQGRVWWALMVVFTSLAILCHVIVGAGAVAGMAIYTGFSWLTASQDRKSALLAAGIKILGMLGLILALALAAYLVPFYRYGQVANRGGFNLPPADQLNQIPIAEFFGLKAIDPRFVLTRMANPLVTSSLFLVGLVLSVRHSRKALALCLTVIVASLYSLRPEIAYSLAKISPILGMVFGLRSMLVLVMVLLPICAAFGVSAVVESLAAVILVMPMRLLGRAAPRPPRLAAVASSLLAPALLSLIVIPLGSVFPSRPFHLSYGPLPYGLDSRDIWDSRADDSCDISIPAGGNAKPLCAVNLARKTLNIEEFYSQCSRPDEDGRGQPALCTSLSPSDAEVTDFLEACQTIDPPKPCRARVGSMLDELSTGNWTDLEVSESDPPIQESQELGRLISTAPPSRIDVSPYLGRLAMDIGAYSDLSLINSYTYQLSLIHEIWGYQQNVFYSREDPVNEYGNPRTLNGLAQWFGTQYVLLDSEHDPIETYQAAGWERTYEEGSLQIWHDPSAPDMATVTTRPAVLVIGTPESDAYMTVFRLANDGMLPYDQALLVEGRSKVDSYSVDELSAFDAVFLYGYDYKDGRKAWNTLASYVEQGGSLFVDTGWEFWIPEWEFESAPDVLPVDRLTWTDYGPATSYELGAPEISGDIDVTKFKPLIWEGNPWTLSGAEASDIREWGRVVLSTGGRPLIVAGSYGQGKVVWSGMNLIGHARYGDPNPEEIQFLGNLVRWLSGVGSGAELPTPIMTREDPDHIDLSFAAALGDVTWLYWRESYYPDWHAYASDAAGEHEIPIYRGGPGLMLMPVRSDTEVASVRLAWVPSWTEQGAIILSALGVLLLAAFFVDGLFLDGNGFTWLRIALTMRMPSPILDEEANLEMAEAQKAELERLRKGFHFGRSHTTRSGHQVRKEPQGLMAPFAEAQAAVPLADEPSPEDKLDGDHEALLRSWLESTGHDDDAWAARLIGRNRGDSR